MPQRLTLALVRKELLQGPLATDPGADAEAVAAALCALSIVRLSWLNLGPRLSGLDVLMGGRLKELHLQHNSLSTIGDGLELLGGTLEFLSLSHNRLRAVEGLSELRKLKVLDLSDNWIDALDADELPPRSLRILELHGNPCMTRVAAAAGGGGGAVGAAACRAACAARCPQLIELDQDPVERGAAAGGEAEGTGRGGSSSSISSSSTGVAAVAQHEYVREATDALWAAVLGEEAAAKAEAVAFGQPYGPGADDDGGGGAAATVGKEAYRALHCRMYWALVGPAGGADDADVDAAFGEDWLRDCGVADAQLLAAGGGGSGDPAAAQAQAATTADAKLRMTRAAFGGAMLDTAAHFCGAEGDGGERHDPVRVAAFLRQLLRDIAATDVAPVRWRPVAEIKGLFVGSGAVRAANATTVEGGGGGAEDDDAEDAAMRAMEAELRQARDEAITAAESRLEGADLEEVQAMRAKLAAGRRDRAEALAAAQADGMARIELAAGQLRGKLGEMGARRAARSKALKSAAAETDQRIAALGERNSHK
jgi:hypothetical protein